MGADRKMQVWMEGDEVLSQIAIKKKANNTSMKRVSRWSRAAVISASNLNSVLCKTSHSSSANRPDLVWWRVYNVFNTARVFSKV